MMNKFTRIIMLIVVMALSVTALAACGNNRDPEEVATAYFEDAKKEMLKILASYSLQKQKIVGFIGGNAELMKSISEDLKSYKIRKVEEKMKLLQ